MRSSLIFHPLIQRDLDGILKYYSDEVSDVVADQFFEAFLAIVNQAKENPKRFHFENAVLRRAKIHGFPYHFLYREISSGIRVLVVRHDKRHPSFGMRRK